MGKQTNSRENTEVAYTHSHKIMYLLVTSIVTSNTALYCCIVWGVKVTTANMCDWLGMLRVVADKSKTPTLPTLRDICKEIQCMF